MGLFRLIRPFRLGRLKGGFGTFLPGDEWGAVLGERPFDYLFSIVNGTIIPESVLNLPQKLAINYHDGPLPRYAGMYATSWAILHGEREHGVTWHVMTAVVDAGDILQQVAVPIAPDETALTLNVKCYDAAIASFAELVRQLADGTVVRQPQDLSERTYFGLGKRPSTIINWQDSAEQISALVRGLTFGTYDNALGLAKMLVEGRGARGERWEVRSSSFTLRSSLFVVREVEVLAVRSGEAAGVVTAVAPYRVQVATGTHDVVLTQLVTLAGEPVYELPVQVDEQLPILDGETAELWREEHERVARHEAFWRKRLVGVEPVVLPQGGGGTGDWRLEIRDWEIGSLGRFAPVDWWTAVCIALIARLSGLVSFDVGWEVVSTRWSQTSEVFKTSEVFMADVVPFRVAIGDDWTLGMIVEAVAVERQRLARRGTYARDLVLRYGELEAVDFAVRLRQEGDGVVLVGGGVSDWETAVAALLDAVLANPDLPLREMPLLTETERERALLVLAGDELRIADGGSVVEMFAAQVGERPSSVAAICGEAQLTYAELDIKADALALQLQEMGVKPGMAVGVFVGRGLDVLVAMWGIWRAGGVYVPLDPEYPAERLRFMMGDVGTAVVVTQTDLLGDLPEMDVAVLVLGGVHAPSPSPSQREGLGEGVAYVIYTSGSTGRPKGVMVGHEAIAAHCVSVQQVYQITPEDRVLQFSSYSFDTSIEQMLVALLNGATLVMRGEEMWGAQEAAHWLADYGVTVANLPTAYWHSLVLGWRTAVLPANDLRLMIVGGEAMRPEMADMWQQSAMGDVRLLNAYGPTETTVTALVWEVGSGEIGDWRLETLGSRERLIAQLPNYSGSSVPIGRPLPGRTAVVVDGFGQVVPAGVVGELWLGGIGLARGYVNSEQWSVVSGQWLGGGEQKLITDNWLLNTFYKTGDLVRWEVDGAIVFVGRVDEQVKVRGYRIELGEIESAVRQVKGMAETAVIVREDRPGDKQIVAYVTGKATVEEIQNYLITQLPSYMLPSAVMQLDKLPLSPNGKVDRRALPVPEVTGQVFVPLRGAVEEVLAGVWTAVLGVNSLGREDNFFELGGDSLRATRLVAQVNGLFRLDVPLRSLFAQPTIGEFAAELVRGERMPGQVATIARLYQEVESLDGAEIAQKLAEVGYYFEDAPVIVPRPQTALPQLSFAQQRLWFLDQLVPQNPAYIIPVVVRLRGVLNTAVLHESLQIIIQRHEVLRTVFERQNGRPVPVVVPVGEAKVDLPIEDVRGWHEGDVWERVEGLVRRPFNLAQFPLIRPTLLCVEEAEHILVLPHHHIISDGWSVDNLLAEWGRVYGVLEDPHPNPPPKGEGALPIRYGDYAVWERGEVEKAARQTQLAYWRQQLAGELPVLQLPLDYARPSVQSFEGGVFRMEIGRLGRFASGDWRLETDQLPNYPITQLLSEFGREEGATLFMTLLAAFKVLLWRYTGQGDLLVGSPVANRPLVELEELIGLFVNTVVLRTEVAGELTFRQLLRRVRQVASEAFAHQAVPFEMVVEAVQPERDLSHQPLFQVMFALNEASGEVTWGEARGERVSVDAGTAKFDLTLTVENAGDELVTQWQYNCDLFAAETIERMAGHYGRLLAAVVAEPDLPISQLPLLSEAERRQILAAWNEPMGEVEAVCLHELFERQVVERWRETAVRFEDEVLTYGELNARANQLAHYLQKCGAGPDVPVGIYMGRGLAWPVAMLAVMKAGGAYVPLDPRFPPERVGFMLADAGAPVVLMERSLPLVDVPAGVQAVFVDDALWQDEPVTNPVSGVTAKDLVYVLFTSGSTGRSKGVAVEHRQLVHYVTAVTERLELPPHAHYATVSTFAADLGHTVIFPSLVLGGCLHIISEDRVSDPNALADYFGCFPIDCLKIVPSHLAALLTVPQPQRLLPRYRLILGGEASSWQLMARVHQLAAATCRIFNHYGPTETTVGVCTFEIGRLGDWEVGSGEWREVRGEGRGETDAAPFAFRPSPHALHSATVPIGRPLPRTQLYILDEQMQPVPIGVTGELYIGGAGVAREYLGRLKLTAERFVQLSVIGYRYSDDGSPITVYRTGDLARWLPDGNVEFLGRVDHQVKVRGFRVELGEIEAVLRQVTAVHEALVVAQDERLVAYIVGDVAESELHNYLVSQLPNYMHPSAYVFLEQLPLTDNGKIDRRALPLPDVAVRSEAFVVARTVTERALAAIWADLLGLEAVSVADDFFVLGGHSLLATQLISRIRRGLGVELPIRGLFEAPTVAGLARLIDGGGTAVTLDELLDLTPEIELDEAIQPSTDYEFVAEPQAVFLTGATGFLGAFLLAELLQGTTAVIYCLVRGGGGRIEANLRGYGLWQEGYGERVVAVVGDLERPLLGLTAGAFAELAEKVDIIVHNGAWVNFVYPYEVLKAANVGGTQEILRLAGQHHTKAVHYVSTLSVFPEKDGVVYEGDDLVEWRGLAGGYAQSKWVAERVLMLAQARGFPAAVYRPGRITGHGETAVFNPDDFLFKLIKGCIQLGCAPLLEMQVDMTPVDYVSGAIGYLLQQPETVGRAFHLLNGSPMSWGDLVAWLQGFGYELVLLPYEAWRQKVLVAPADNALQPFRSIFEADALALDDVNEFAVGETAVTLANTPITCPPVDATLLSAYFSHFVDVGFLDRPVTSGKVQVKRGGA